MKNGTTKKYQNVYLSFNDFSYVFVKWMIGKTEEENQKNI